MQKRTNPLNNPFEKKKNNIQEQQNPVQQEYFEEEPVYTQPQRPQPVYKTTQYQPVQEPIRDKFTSTMDRELRRTIKIICAQRGIMFTQFVEEACREKLQREGR